MTSTSGWLRQQGRPVRGRLALTIALGEAAGILLVVQTSLLVSVVDRAMFHGSGFASLLPVLFAMLTAVALRAAATWASRRSGTAAATAVKRSLRAALLQRLRGAGPLALADLRAGEVAHTAVDAVEALDAYYSRYLPQRSIASLLPFTILAVVFPLDWLSGLILVLTAVFLPLSMVVIGEEAHERNSRLWGTLARMSGRFLDVLQGLTTVRMFAAAGREARAIGKASDEYRTVTLSVLRIAFLSSFMLELISAVSIAIVAVVSGVRLLAGGMSFFPAYFILLIAPEYFLTLRQLGTFYHSRMEAVSAAEQVRAFLDLPVFEQPASAAKHQATSSGAPTILFRDVRFAYADRPVLEGLSLRIEPGEHVTLTGQSGTGKSTILALLLRFAQPSSGWIEIDGVPFSLLDPAAWRTRVAWLPQRPTIFRGTLRMNITLGREGSSAQRIDEAVLRAHVDEFLARLPDGLDTHVGEAGQGLSVGQAQRVALARLFLREPGLVLLDEPTAHLDEESAGLVSDGIEALCASRTAITVTHRAADPASTASRIVVLKDGRLDGAP